jgi:hypothetical protein
MSTNVIWQTNAGLQTEFEKQFIEKLILSDVDVRDIVYDGRFAIYCDNSIVIVSHNSRAQNLSVTNYLRKARGVTLIHLSGENLYDATWMYENVNVVFRSYYDPRIKAENVYALPLGFKSGFFETQKSPEAFSFRKLVWCFVGELKNHRVEMLNAFNKVRPHYVHLTKGWNSDAGFTVNQMRSLYGRSNFALCPHGWINPDSFRVMEALENGSIPVTVKFRGIDYFRYVYGDHPFVVGNTWHEAAKLVKDLMNLPDELTRKRNSLNSWYLNFKKQLASDVAGIIQNERSCQLSKQFQYQKEGAKNDNLSISFDWHFRLRPRLIELATKVLR